MDRERKKGTLLEQEIARLLIDPGKPVQQHEYGPGDAHREIVRLLLGPAAPTPLEKFALKRGLPTEGKEWRDNALLSAALEHPELQVPKRRGRPKKTKPRGLFFLLSEIDPELSALLQEVDDVKALALEQGHKISDRKAARLIELAAEFDKIKARGCPLPKPGSDELRAIVEKNTFQAAWRNRQNKISKARTQSVIKK